MTTPHTSPFVSYDAATVAAHERYRASLDRARQQRPAPVTPPPATARDHLWLFVRSALAMGAVVVVLLALFWIGGGR